MIDSGPGVLRHWDTSSFEIRNTIEAAVLKALSEHRKLGQSVVIWEQANDRIVILRSDQIPTYNTI